MAEKAKENLMKEALMKENLMKEMKVWLVQLLRGKARKMTQHPKNTHLYDSHISPPEGNFGRNKVEIQRR